MQAHSIGLFFKRSCLRNERVDNVRLVNLCFNIVFCFSFILLAFSLKDLDRYLTLLGFYGNILTDIAIGTQPMVAP